jgi:hypothetical protein
MLQVQTSVWRLATFVFALTAVAGTGLCDEMKFVSVNGPGPGGTPYPADLYRGYYYVSPYYGKDLTTGQSDIILFCLDFNHDINFGQEWNAVIHQLPSSQADFNAAKSTFQFGNVPNGSTGPTFVQPVPSGEMISLNSWQRYQVAARLFNNELGLLGPNLQSTSAIFSRDRAVYQYAVWEVFLENNFATGGHTYNYLNDFKASYNLIVSMDPAFKTDVRNVLDEALAHYSTADLAGWSIISPLPPDTPSSAQEFFSRSFTTNPEPSALALLGMVLALWVCTAWRRRRQRPTVL